MSANGPQARNVLLGTNQDGRLGACWYFVWQSYAAAGATTSHGSIQYAYDAAYASDGKHYDRNPPHGAAVWLGKRYDGNAAGDVFIAGVQDGTHAATDQPTYGAPGETSISARESLTGRPFMFWTDHVLDCPIDLGGSTPSPNDDEEETMRHLVQIDPANDGRYFILDLGLGVAQRVWNGLQLDLARREPNMDQVAGGQPADVLQGLEVRGE